MGLEEMKELLLKAAVRLETCPNMSVLMVLVGEIRIKKK
jgi:hypothetical protein